MLWHRQAIFESKGDKLSSSAECRIRTQGVRHLIVSRLNACWQIDWAIQDQSKKTHCKLVFAPGSGGIHIRCWCMHTCMHIYMHTCIHTYTHKHTSILVVANSDALAQASDIQIERRQVVFLCWKQNLKPGSQTPNRQQTECSLTSRLSYWGSS